MDKNTQQPVAWLRYLNSNHDIKRLDLQKPVLDVLQNNGWSAIPLYTAPLMPRDVLMDALLEMLDAIVVQTRALTGFSAVIDEATIRDIADKYSVVSSEFEENDSSDSGCKFPLCQNEQYQHDMAEALHRELYTGQPEPVSQQLLAALEALVAIADNGCADAWRGEWDDARVAIAAAEAAQPVITDELSCDDIERLRMALSWEGYSTPEGLEQCAARWPELVRDLIRAVLNRKTRAQQPASAQPVAVPDAWINTVNAAAIALEAAFAHVPAGTGDPSCRANLVPTLSALRDMHRALLSAAQKPEGVE